MTRSINAISLMMLCGCLALACGGHAHSSSKSQPVHSTLSGVAGRSNLTEKHARSSFSEPGYGHQVWGNSAGRFDLSTILPPVLLFGLFLLLLPVCVGLLAPMFAGQASMSAYPYPHGRKRRHAFEEPVFAFEDWPYSGLTHHVIRPILDTLQKSLMKYAK